MSLTIDASVFVAALRTSESRHPESRQFFDRIAVLRPSTYCPALVVTETVAAIARTGCDTESITAAQYLVTGLPGIALVDLTAKRCQDAANLAATHKLRGADACYALVAIEQSATLITLDREMLDRAPAAVTALTPADWLAANPPAAAVT